MISLGMGLLELYERLILYFYTCDACIKRQDLCNGLFTLPDTETNRNGCLEVIYCTEADINTDSHSLGPVSILSVSLSVSVLLLDRVYVP